ncbi:hypothetical protein Ddc_17648 [Ditylenchus destructor]|nr:hypothetical protein Ddc_17648 [Ditylenchus destructor]
MSAQSNVKTESEDVNTSEPEFLGTVETRKRKAVPKPLEHISHRNEENEEILGSVEIRKQKTAPVHNQKNASSKYAEHILRRSEGKTRQNVRLEEESSGLRQMKQDKINMMSDKAKPGPSQVDLKRIQGDMMTDLIVVFDNCDSAAKCIEQRKHKIRGRDFIVWAESPTKSMKKKMRAKLEQSMPGSSSENVATQNDRSNFPTRTMTKFFLVVFLKDRPPYPRPPPPISRRRMKHLCCGLQSLHFYGLMSNFAFGTPARGAFMREFTLNLKIKLKFENNLHSQG